MDGPASADERPARPCAVVMVQPREKRPLPHTSAVGEALRSTAPESMLLLRQARCSSNGGGHPSLTGVAQTASVLTRLAKAQHPHVTARHEGTHHGPHERITDL